MTPKCSRNDVLVLIVKRAAASKPKWWTGHFIHSSLEVCKHIFAVTAVITVAACGTSSYSNAIQVKLG